MAAGARRVRAVARFSNPDRVECLDQARAGEEIREILGRAARRIAVEPVHRVDHDTPGE
jgi:hypothetical protein